MTNEELDILWGRALHDSVAAGEMYTRYRFAALVAAAEREECAKVCEYRAMALDYSGNQYVRDHAALDCARSIRARGNP